MASIRKKGKRWYVRYREAGKQREACAGRTRRDAADFAALVEARQRRGLPGVPAPVSQAGIQDMMQAYLQDRARSAAASTLKNIRISMELFGEMLRVRRRGKPTTEDMTRASLGDYYQHLMEDREVKIGTARQRVEHVQAFWRWAYDHDDYGEIMPRPRKLDMPDQLPRMTIAPTFAELDACIAAAHLDWHRRCLVIMRFTGLRVAQAVALQWDDFDPKALTLTVRPELGKSKRERAGRRIPYSALLRDEMLTWAGARTGTVVPRRNDRSFVSRTRQAWERAEVRKEVWDASGDFKGQPNHAFRKGFQTELLARGAFPVAVDILLGHQLANTRDPYVDPTALPQLRAAVDLIPPIASAKIIPIRSEGKA